MLGFFKLEMFEKCFYEVKFKGKKSKHAQQNEILSFISLFFSLVKALLPPDSYHSPVTTLIKK